ncbi:hypothetical protein N7453_005878 [Penicillium expansum]|nr:hypothetical protein N7453_005878 [Penicillium expansum]
MATDVDKSKEVTNLEEVPKPEEVTKSEKKVVLTLLQYDKLSNSSTPKSTVSLPLEYRALTLQHLRWYLIQNGHLPKEYVNNTFCKENGAVVTDDTTFDTYTQMNGDSGGEKDNIEEFSLYYKMVKAMSGMDETTKEFLAQKLDLSLRDHMPFLNPTLNKLESKFKSDDWKATASTASVTHVADMDERQWGVVMRNNDLLSGKFFAGGDTDDKLAIPTSISRARYTAFALKEREIPEYNITFKLATTPPNGIKAPEVKFRIPRYQICDSSKVEVFETQSSVSASMAENAFSQTTIEASAGGGAFGVSIGVKAGATTSNSSSFASSSAKDERRMHVSYMFPRVDIFLEAEDLELTKECHDELKKVRDPQAKKEDADNFFRKFGHVFVPRVQLGGRLYSVEKTESIAGSNSEEKASALKAAASASVSGWGFQAQVSASHESTQNSKVEKSNSSSIHSITWHADGGDTLLCNNPPAWCPTVQSYYNWRVMNQIGMIDIVELIGRIPGYQDIPKQFKRIYYSDVQFKICLWNSSGGPKHVIESSEGGGGNYSRRAKRHALKKSQSGEEHMDATLEISALKDQLIWEGSEGKTPRFKYGVHYPLRFFKRDSNGQPIFYGVRRTTLEERYQKPNFLYGGLNEEPNVWVMFRNVNDSEATERADKIGSTNEVRMDFYDAHTRQHYGWLQNNGGMAYIEANRSHYDPMERKFKFYYV